MTRFRAWLAVDTHCLWVIIASAWVLYWGF